MFRTSRTLPRQNPKLSNLVKRVWVRDVTEKPMITLAELQRCCVQMGEGSRRSTTTAARHQSEIYSRRNHRLRGIKVHLEGVKLKP